MTSAITTANVLVLMPPPVEELEAPMNMRTININSIGVPMQAHVDSVESAGARGALKDSGGDASCPPHIGYGAALARLQEEVADGANGDEANGVVQGDFGGKANALPRFAIRFSRLSFPKRSNTATIPNAPKKTKQGDGPVHQPSAGTLASASPSPKRKCRHC